MSLQPSILINHNFQINEGPNFHLEVQQVPVPQPGPGQLLIKLNVTGLCGSDVHYMLNDLGSPVGMKDFNVRSPGHEGAGVVVKVCSKLFLPLSISILINV